MRYEIKFAYVKNEGLIEDYCFIETLETRENTIMMIAKEAIADDKRILKNQIKILSIVR